MPTKELGPRECPECRDGKHGNCYGWGWDDDLDEAITPCPCESAGHGDVQSHDVSV